MTNNSLACSCLFLTAEEAVKDIDYIYIGLATESKLQENGDVYSTIKIEEILTGEPDKNIIQGTWQKYGLCGREVVIGEKYIVFGLIGEIPKFSSCAKTKHLYSHGDHSSYIDEIKAVVTKNESSTNN